MEPLSFTMTRKADASGVSGPGRVLDGVIFPNGKTVVCWRTEVKHGHSSVGVYDSFEAFKFIHIDSHPTNGTEIQWLSGREYKPESPLPCCSPVELPPLNDGDAFLSLPHYPCKTPKECGALPYGTYHHTNGSIFEIRPRYCSGRIKAGDPIVKCDTCDGLKKVPPTLK